MFKGSDIFEKHYNDYCDRISKINFEDVKEVLKVNFLEEDLEIRLMDQAYRITKQGIKDLSGNRPNYGICVILAKYLLLCPDRIHHDPEWVSIKDFKKDANFTNVNFFTSDTQQVILRQFEGRHQQLFKACEKLGGVQFESGTSYDLSMQINALPRISLLLLYNDSDGRFPAYCTVLFQKHAEYYLDPESLVMISALFARRLVAMDT